MARPSRTSKRKKIIELVERWKPILHLDSWVLAVSFFNDDSDLPEEDRGEGVAGLADSRDEYELGELGFVLDHIGPDDLEETVVHELVHTIQAPLEHAAIVMAGDDKVKLEWIRKEKERVVRHLTRIFLSLRLREEQSIDAPEVRERHPAEAIRNQGPKTGKEKGRTVENKLSLWGQAWSILRS